MSGVVDKRTGIGGRPAAAALGMGRELGHLPDQLGRAAATVSAEPTPSGKGLVQMRKGLKAGAAPMDRTAAEAAEVVGAARKRLGELAGQDEQQLARQQSADTKGFKGRGALRRLRDALRAVDTVHHEMAELVKLSTEVVGRSMYLCTHRRALNEQVSLRWRASGEAGGHLSWAEAQGLIQNYPRDLRTWYSEANRLVQELNTREKAVRAALRQARAEVAGQQAELNEEGMESLL